MLLVFLRISSSRLPGLGPAGDLAPQAPGRGDAGSSPRVSTVPAARWDPAQHALPPRTETPLVSGGWHSAGQGTAPHAAEERGG